MYSQYSPINLVVRTLNWTLLAPLLHAEVTSRGPDERCRRVKECCDTHCFILLLFLIWNIPFNSVMTFSRVTPSTNILHTSWRIHQPSPSQRHGSAVQRTLSLQQAASTLTFCKACDRLFSVLTLPTRKAAHKRPHFVKFSAHLLLTILSFPF